MSKRARWFYIIAALWLFLSGFFVAKMPVRPELAGVSAIFVVVFALPTYLALGRWLGWPRALLVLAALGAFAVGIESVGILSGWPYGGFHYGEKIGAKLFGLVPWTVPFAWSPLLLGAMVLAARRTAWGWLRALAAALVLVALDLVLDPGATAQKFWIWNNPHGFYGVPWSNFFGWLLSGFAGAMLFQWFVKAADDPPPAALLASTFLTLCFWSSANFWMELWIPALLGALLLVFIGRLFLFSSSHDDTQHDITKPSTQH